jgi:hypothetical protein
LLSSDGNAVNGIGMLMQQYKYFTAWNACVACYCTAACPGFKACDYVERCRMHAVIGVLFQAMCMPQNIPAHHIHVLLLQLLHQQAEALPLSLPR